MRVVLKELQDNPFRNFKVDPINQEVVEGLKHSIKENPAGFWGGIVARRTKKNGIQLAFGHHRVRAAIAVGIREDDIKVSEISDAEMILMYAKENATQRGNSGTAVAGTVASAIRFLLKGAFTGNLGGFPPRSKRSLEVVNGQIGTERGLGWDIILEFLGDVPGVNQNTVKQQLANLKASGDYDEIVETVKAEIEEENKEALKDLKRQEEEQRKAAEAQALADKRAAEAEERRKQAVKDAKAAKEEADKRRAEKEQADAELAAKRAEKEAELAAKRAAESEEKMKDFDALRKTRDAVNKAAGVEREVTFDFEGVAKHFNNASHIDAFRQIATSEGTKPYLPVSGQAGVAKRLVALAKANDEEVTSKFIRLNFMEQLSGAKRADNKISAEEKAALLRNDWSAKAKMYQEDAARQARGFLAAAMNLAEHSKKRPAGVTLQITGEFKTALQNIKRAVALIDKVMS